MQKIIQRTFLVVVSIIVAIMYFTLGWTAHLSNLGGDSAGYLLAAQYYSPYHAATAVLSDYATQIIFPPLLPALLAIFGGGENMRVAHELVMCFLLLAMVALYLWARIEKFSIWMSGTLVFMFALMPATYLISFNVWTENLYLMFSLIAVVALSHEGATEERMWLLAAVAVSAALMTRVAALPLAFAFCAYLALYRPRKTLILAAIALGPFLMWAVVSAIMQKGAGAYVTHLEGKYSGDPIHIFIAQAITESKAMLHVWHDAWIGGSRTKAISAIIYAAGVLSLVGWLLRLRNLRFDAIYVAAYLVVLLVWPHPEEALRYSYVLFPLLIFYSCQALMRMPEFVISGRSYHLSAIVFIALLAISMLPTFILNFGYFTEQVPAAYVDSKHAAVWYSSDRKQASREAKFQISLMNHLKTLSTMVNEEDCIFAIKPTVVSLYSGRRSYIPPLSAVHDDKFWSDLGRCDFVYVLPFASPSFSEPLYPLNRLGSHAKLVDEKVVSDGANSLVIGALLKISR